MDLKHHNQLLFQTIFLLLNILFNFEILPEALSIVITSPAYIFSFEIASIIFAPRSYSVSISVVFNVIFPVLALFIIKITLNSNFFLFKFQQLLLQLFQTLL
jgi:hypothetical protein